MSTEESNVPPKPESMLKSFLAGGVGGACSVAVGHPFDLVKVRMQTASASTATSTVTNGVIQASAGTVAKRTVFGILLETFRTQGVRGLYRGATAPLIAVTPVFAMSFWGYDVGQRIVRWTSGSTAPDLTLEQKCIAGGISALPCTVFMAPSERIKCVLQTSAPGQYAGSFDCAKVLYRSGGIQSIYRGTVFTLLRDVPGSVVWFGTYEFFKHSIMKMQGIEDTKQLSPLAVLTAGGMAGVAMWPIAIPPDVLKSRWQSAPDGTYKSLWDVYQTLMATEGPSALFKGIRPALIRAFPANAACFLGMEMARKLLSFMD